MKLPILAAALLAGAALAQAQVPGLINYQGRLTTPSGAPASGTRNFSLSIFDAETGGTLLYTEAVGPVTLDATGVYSFQFGSAGSSNSQVVETLATTDGTASSFQKVLANTGVVAGSLSVTDGTYTWSQSAGSSNEDDFGVAYSSSLRRVTVSYFSAPPAAGKPITATYRYATSGISGAISTGSQHWMALSIDGVPQAGRQRVLAVPFAMRAAHASKAVEAERLTQKPITWRPESISGQITGINGDRRAMTDTLPLKVPYMGPSTSGYPAPNFYNIYGKSVIPSKVRKLVSVHCTGTIGKLRESLVILSVSVTRYDPTSGSIEEVVSIRETEQGQTSDLIYKARDIEIGKTVNIELDEKSIYTVNIGITTYGIQSSGPPSSEMKDVRLVVVE